MEESSASTEELSSQVEEVVASSSSLGDMATTLNEAVSRFKLDAADVAVGPDSDSPATAGSPESELELELDTEELAA